jgi:hypothetical protein
MVAFRQGPHGLSPSQRTLRFLQQSHARFSDFWVLPEADSPESFSAVVAMHMIDSGRWRSGTVIRVSRNVSRQAANVTQLATLI